MPNPIGIGQVGIGYWGKNLLRNFQALPDAEVVMACDQNADVLDRVARQYPTLATTSRYEDLLESAAVDAVVIATETPQHFAMAEQALGAGKHVFVEKPMAQTVQEAERLVALAEDHDRRLMVGHLLLYHPAFRYVENLIRDGTLGDVHYLYSMRVNLGIIRQRENALESLAPHDLSIALQFIDAAPVAVSAQGQAYLQPDVEDVAFATVYFDDGALAHLHTSWLDPHKIRKVTVVGSQQMAVIDDVASNEKVRLYDKGVDVQPGEMRYADYAEAMTVRTGDIHIPRIDMQEPLRVECQHFLDCIRSGTTPRSDGRNGLAVVKLLDAAQRSLARNGSTVELA
ncbi:MAG: Gfo/Idh/MocA family oxidoreductase [Bacteroidetes bacterium]|jgi:predicted dehydrogenase|nr:Gfo/Idh/MocA family oxidoreductase [Bacteroidota bacterium]